MLIEQITLHATNLMQNTPQLKETHNLVAQISYKNWQQSDTRLDLPKP